jgi:ligand-binding sensor domain-containing protein
MTAEKPILCREHRRLYRARHIAVLAGVLLAWYPRAFALNPALDVSQYAHTAWKVGEDFSKGTINSVVQTPDGYLWLGTELGLLRFDGVRTVAWEPRRGERLPSENISKLLVTRDGGLWIGTAQGLASWKDGRLTHYPELAGQDVFALLEDQEGTIFAGGWAMPVGRLCYFQNFGVVCYGEDGRFGPGVVSLYEDSGRNLWVGAINGLWRWKPGPPRLYPMPERPPFISSLIQADKNTLLIGLIGGVRQFVGGKVEPYPFSTRDRQLKQATMIRDRDGSLWIGTADRGLLHVRQGRADSFARNDGLSSDWVTGLF